MNRRLTNMIRFVMDECLPPLVRDNRWFMYPFFHLAYRGKNIPEVMDFKRLVREYSGRQYLEFYRNLDSISRNRETDLSPRCLEHILAHLDRDAASLLDAGCGGGFLLRILRARRPGLRLAGCDLVASWSRPDVEYVCGSADDLPFRDKAFDVVSCCHTLEHVLDLDRAVAELRRVARRQIVIVVPCQRYYYYTLDEHVHFFPDEASLRAGLGMHGAACAKIQGDWVVLADPAGEDGGGDPCIQRPI